MHKSGIKLPRTGNHKSSHVCVTEDVKILKQQEKYWLNYVI